MNALLIGLGNFLASLFGQSMLFFVKRWNGRILFKQAQLALLLLMLVTLYTAIGLILSGISAILPDALVVPMSWVAPTNINALITAYIGARIAIALFRWKSTQVKLMY